MNDELEQEFHELINEIRSSRKENVTHTRSFVNQVFLLAGALAALLMPAYALTKLAPVQHAFITVALCFLLGCILFGVISLSVVLGQEAQNLEDKQESLEEKDLQQYLQIRNDLQKQKVRGTHDARGAIVVFLFGGGVLLLMVGIVLGAYGL